MKKIYRCIIVLFIITSIKPSSLFSQAINLGQIIVKEQTEVSIFSDFINTETADFVNNGLLYMYGNINNNGLFTFTDDFNSSMYLYGDKAQVIEGNLPLEVLNIEFNNSSSQPAFTLLAGLDIYGTAEFTEGIVDNSELGNGLVTFFPGAFSTGMYDESFVNGAVEKVGNEAFTFPIGKEKFYRSAIITGDLDIIANITSEYYLDNSDSSYPHTNRVDNSIHTIDNTEYWTIKGDVANANLVLTLSWNENTTPAKITNGISDDNIHIVRWDADNSQWIDEGGIVNTNEKTVTTPLAISGSGVFTLARVLEYNTSPHITVYNAVSPNGDGNNDYFIIEDINLYPKNKVQIFNRWGVKLFETENYGNNGNVFKGFSDGRTTINRDGRLQTGTYFYVIEYEYTGDTNPRTIKKTGYLYLNND